MSRDLILKDVADPILRENFARIQAAFSENIFLNSGFRFIEVDIPQKNFAFPVPHGLNYVPTDIIPLSADGDFNYYFRSDETDRKYIYVAAHGPVRLRFLAGKFNQSGRRVLKDSELPFVAPQVGVVSSGGSSTPSGGSDGWAFIQDSARTAQSPLNLIAGTRTRIPNDGLGAQTNYLNAPANASTWWNTSQAKFYASVSGEFYTFRINFQLTPSLNNKSVLVEADIGTGNSPFATTSFLSRGAGVTNRFALAIPFPIGPSAFSNGISFFVTSECDATVMGINLTVVRNYHL